LDDLLMNRIRNIVGLALVLAHSARSALFLPRSPALSVEERLKMLPLDGAPVSAPVAIHWDEHMIPFIEAATDVDLATALGVVHAHLRLGQMELMRRIALGRVSEMVGPAGIEIDRIIRMIGIGRAVPQMATALAPETRGWIEAFAAGVNFHLARVKARPLEFALLGIEPEPWTATDLLAVGRLAGADISWMLLSRLLAIRAQAGPEAWPALWRRLLSDGAVPVPSFAGGDRSVAGVLGALITAFGRTGSNSVAVAGARSASGGAMIASDPHLSVNLPNLWLVAGFRSPSYHAVGMMIPGLPFVALGRNKRIAWGGTNLHAASSDLFDIASVPPAEIAERSETIRVRWWGRARVSWRESTHGPVLSDSAMFRRGSSLALRWVGHRPSDEIGAMLAVNRAQGWREFRAALDGFAVPGQTMVYADAEGHVGKATAAHLPRRPAGSPADLVADIERHTEHWDGLVTSLGLPSECDPARGFVASANDRPPGEGVPVGFFFSSTDRIDRLIDLLGGNDRVTPEDLSALQQDVFLASAVALRDALLPRLRALAAADPRGATIRLVEALAGWDGHYRTGSDGALAFELLLFHLVREIVPPDRLAAYRVVWTTIALIAADIDAMDPAGLDRALAKAAQAAAPRLGEFRDWGGMHRLRVTHLLSAVPLLGRRFVFGDFPAGGSNDTVMKTAHGISGKRHATRYGACARHISDLADPDRNQFCLLGGQDGWFGSAAFIDQVPLWHRGEGVTVPLNPETVRRQFRHRTDLLPSPAA